VVDVILADELKAGVEPEAIDELVELVD